MERIQFSPPRGNAWCTSRPTRRGQRAGDQIRMRGQENWGEKTVNLTKTLRAYFTTHLLIFALKNKASFLGSLDGVFKFYESAKVLLA